jgi:hypothetical protein
VTNFTIIDGKAERIIDIGKVNTELFLRLKQYAKNKANSTGSAVLGDSVEINFKSETQHGGLVMVKLANLIIKNF